MTAELRVPHGHQPVYRVVRRSWADPLDASFSRRAAERRWNTGAFAALYCCCSLFVAKAVIRDILGFAGLELAELQPGAQPRLVEIVWTGTAVVDVASAAGIAAAGFPSDYPAGVDKSQTRERAAAWHADGAEGVVCRSASLHRLGLRRWEGPHEAWGELAIFVENSASPPSLAGIRDDLGGSALPGR